jgi:amino-acid N-acetyltransferase
VKLYESFLAKGLYEISFGFFSFFGNPMDYLVRKARVGDAGAIYDLLRLLAADGLLLPRSYSNIYEMLQTFYVAEGRDGTLAGVGALQVAWEDLGEVRSLAVPKEFRGEGIGKAITLAVEEDAKALGLKKMFALTYVPEFFEKLGYAIAPLSSLPQKIWAVCFNCIYYPDCREIAVMKIFEEEAKGEMKEEATGEMKEEMKEAP